MATEKCWTSFLCQLSKEFGDSQAELLGPSFFALLYITIILLRGGSAVYKLEQRNLKFGLLLQL